jgi:hypothetical protein
MSWRAGYRENTSGFRHREKCSLDIPSPRTWLTTPVESTNLSCQVFGASDPPKARSTALIGLPDCLPSESWRRQLLRSLVIERRYRRFRSQLTMPP